MPLPERSIDRDLLLDLSYGDEPDDCGWTVVENEITGTWRWGTNHRIVLKARDDDTYWGICYQKTTGDENHNDINDLGNPAKLDPMIAEEVPVVSTTFRRMKESDATPRPTRD